jgi:uncharacterized protein (TIGR00369 family)
MAKGEGEMARITPERFQEIVRETLPFGQMLGAEILDLAEGRARFRLPFKAELTRHGGTIGGPFMMGLADMVMYAVVLSCIPDAEGAVTSNLTMNFLRRPGPAAMIADGRMLRLGRRLAFGEVELFSEGDPDMVAHATATYALPGR